MKIFLNIILFLFSFQIEAQFSVYHPFPDSNAIWRISWGEQSCFLSGLPQAEFRYILETDTIINSVSYKKINREIGFPFACGPTYPPGIGYMGGMRQDTTNRKVYFIPKDSLNEKLIYDFSLNIGDTLPRFIFDQYSIQNTTLLRIDSILINGSFRRYFITNNDNKIIEGIGLESGLLEAYHFDFTPQLICFIQDSIELYKFSAGISCDLITNIENHFNQEHSINIYPNPSQKYITLEFAEEPISSSFIIYNQYGVEMVNEILKFRKQYINCELFSKGIYFYKIIRSSNNIYTGKLVLE